MALAIYRGFSKTRYEVGSKRSAGTRFLCVVVLPEPRPAQALAQFLVALLIEQGEREFQSPYGVRQQSNAYSVAPGPGP